MTAEQIMLLAAVLGLLTAVLTLGKSYLEYQTVRLKNQLQQKINTRSRQEKEP